MTEIIVFGARAGASAAAHAKSAKPNASKKAEKEIEALTKMLTGDSGKTPLPELRKTMWEKVGIVRSGAGLMEALTIIKKHQKTAASLTAGDAATLRAIIETRFAATAAQLVAESALKREESRGTHFRTDCPSQLEEYAKPYTIQK
jgi:succinate dehydrogenase/fumarate reductase flavoprotein subunit